MSAKDKEKVKKNPEKEQETKIKKVRPVKKKIKKNKVR